MLKVKKSLLGSVFIESKPKKTRQGSGQHTKYSASSGNKAPRNGTVVKVVDIETLDTRVFFIANVNSYL